MTVYHICPYNGVSFKNLGSPKKYCVPNIKHNINIFCQS